MVLIQKDRGSEIYSEIDLDLKCILQYNLLHLPLLVSGYIAFYVEQRELWCYVCV